jgi:hypothetical protein
MSWWWYLLIALGGVTGIGVVFAVVLQDDRADLMPMGRHWVQRRPEPAKPRKRWRIIIERQ